ncbi:MAG: hypothetical protein JWM80_2712 [Cyanobacteria bacterium RYN_339]|nr:hypothetical protein [Cyanobacteria bacterium RYN_339]
MKPFTLRSKPENRRLGLAALAACWLTGCHAATTTAPVDEGVVRSTRTAASLINEGGPVFGKPADATLINEGGPVFGKPTNPNNFQLGGLVVLPRYYTGGTTDLKVSAERLDGGAVPDLGAVPVGDGGSFLLQGPATGKFFFAATSFTQEDTIHRVRALARADAGGGQLTIDAASSLLSAKIALAEQKRHLFTIDYQETQDLGQMVRYKLGTQLQTVQLDAANAELSNALNVLARQDDGLRERIRSWEYTLDPTLKPTPETMPAATSVVPTTTVPATTGSGGSPGNSTGK